MGDDGLLSTSQEHHLEQKPLKYLKMRPVISPVHMGHHGRQTTASRPCWAGWGVSRSVSPGPDGLMGYGSSYVGWYEP